ncbi:4-hydroxy-3-methylbut-2-enyl diphosphate reductase [Prosthecomicrobium sp. N25]|uniref:4-hydroxy-3-methylbut-2-enyl diphosphate reductase n=1 Tax=Prosthecomicrobium sp. N25 TaxID=3129254 RepID=UPI0030785A65
MRRPLKVILAKPRGFCAGVVRAIDIVERALDDYGAPVYVRHEIVHNRAVVEDLRARGAVFVESLDAVPEGALTIFSAHGVSNAVEAEAAGRGLDVIDATCPLVQKVHAHGRAYAEKGYDVVLIGHAGHPEVEGTRGRVPGRLHVVGTVGEVAGLEVADPERVAYITQTTLSLADTREIIAALTRRFPAVVGPDMRDICYATQNRQLAVLRLVEEVQALVVIGSRNSSNSNRLQEIGAAAGIPSRLIDGPADLDPAWLFGVDTIGITAGASAPERLVTETVTRLDHFRDVSVEVLDGVEETVRFRLPARLMTARRALRS